MKLLFLASYFPKPGNQQMGNWALEQAKALSRIGVKVQVVSFTAWVPKIPSHSEGLKAYSNCPKAWDWGDGVVAEYPRWCYYPHGPLRTLIYRYPSLQLSLVELCARRWLENRIKGFEPDIIFCHHTLPNAWLALRTVEGTNVPVVTLDHDFDEIQSCEFLQQRKKKYAYVADKASGMLGVSNKMRDDIKRLFPQANVLTMHNGVNVFPSEDSGANETFRTTVVFLCCAFFAERKGIPLLIEAFDSVAARNENIELRIVGGGPQEDLIRKKISQSDYFDKIKFLGKLDHQKVVEEMHNCDCFVLTGWNEPFATVYLEAMAAGKPIICCDDGGIMDIIQSGVHGLAVPAQSKSSIEDALEFMAKNPGEISRMGANASALINTSFTWDASAKRLLDFFNLCLKKND